MTKQELLLLLQNLPDDADFDVSDMSMTSDSERNCVGERDHVVISTRQVKLDLVVRVTSSETVITTYMNRNLGHLLSLRRVSPDRRG